MLKGQIASRPKRTLNISGVYINLYKEYIEFICIYVKSIHTVLIVRISTGEEIHRTNISNAHLVNVCWLFVGDCGLIPGSERSPAPGESLDRGPQAGYSPWVTKS